MRTFGKITGFLLALALIGLSFSVAPRQAAAQDQNSVTVADQTIKAGTVTIASVTSKQAGWIAIHSTADKNPVIGETYVPAGTTANVVVSISLDGTTAGLIAMLHIDAGKPGVYEFPGADVPANGADGKIVAPTFNVIGVDVDDQALSDKGTVTIGKVIAQQDGWIAIHSSADKFPVVGSAPIKKGVNEDVEVTITDPKTATDKMTAMIHIDAGTIGKYEFPGADVPAAVGGAIVNEPFWTTDHVRTLDQIAAADGTIVVPYVFAKKDGWIAIHSSATGNPVIGHVAVKAGLTDGLTVKIDDPKTITPTVLVMLHIDAGKAGTYEFPGPDVPVMDASGKPVAPAMLIGEGVRASDQTFDAIKTSGYVLVDSVVSAKNGWMAIHSSATGNPVIGATFVHAGANPMVWVKVKPEDVTDTLLAMLHVDAGKPGVYEFPGADVPVNGADGKIIAPAFKVSGVGAAAAATAKP